MVAQYDPGAPEEPDETPANVTPLVLPYTRQPNAYVDQVLGRVSPFAGILLVYLIRQTAGFQRDAVELTDAELMRGRFHSNGTRLDYGTGLRQTKLREARAELKAAGVLDFEAHHGRGKATRYALKPPSAWTLGDAKPSPREGFADEDGEPGTKPSQKPSPREGFAKPSPREGFRAAKGSPRGPLSIDASALGDPFAPGGNGAAELNATQSPTIPERKSLRKKDPHPPSSSASRVDGEAGGSERSKVFAADTEAHQLAAYMRDAILGHTPSARVPKAERDLQSWARVFDLMLRRDERDAATIRRVIDWATRDRFWRPNILSPGKLREKYDTLHIRAEEERGRTGSNGTAGQTGHESRGIGTGQPGAARPTRGPAAPDPTNQGRYAGVIAAQRARRLAARADASAPVSGA